MNSDLTAHNAGWSVERNISRCFVIVEEGCIFVGKSVIKLVKRGTEEMTTAERLYNTAKELPEPVVAEILDFAEFLRKKRVARDVTVSKEMLIDLAGGLESSKTFSGDILEIQRRLRDEWE